MKEFMVLRSSKHVKNQFVYDGRTGDFTKPFKGAFEEAYALIDFLVSIGDNEKHFMVYELTPVGVVWREE